MKETARTKILDAADELFGAVGFDAATTRQIAEQCSVNKALIHYHFKGKDDLFNAVLDRYYASLARVVQDGLQTTGSLRDRLRAVIDTYVDFLSANENFSRMVQREASGGRHVDRILSHMIPMFEGAASLLQETYPSTKSGSLSAPQLMISFYGMIVSYFTYGPVVQGLIGADTTSGAQIELRKQHLHRMLDLVLEAIEAGE